MEVSWLDLFFVVVNWIMLVLIFVAFFLILILLVRFLWRQGSKKAVPVAEANSEETAVGNLGEALRRRRQGCGMTQELVAEQLGVSRQAVSRWEKGEARPSTANIQALAGLYGIAPAELLQEAKR